MKKKEKTKKKIVAKKNKKATKPKKPAQLAKKPSKPAEKPGKWATTAKIKIPDHIEEPPVQTPTLPATPQIKSKKFVFPHFDLHFPKKKEALPAQKAGESIYDTNTQKPVKKSFFESIFGSKKPKATPTDQTQAAVPAAASTYTIGQCTPKSSQDGKILTDFDNVLNYMKVKKKASYTTIAKELAMPWRRVDECCSVLREQKKVEIVYPPFGDPVCNFTTNSQA